LLNKINVGDTVVFRGVRVCHYQRVVTTSLSGNKILTQLSEDETIFDG
jgi:hypothetical protein